MICYTYSPGYCRYMYYNASLTDRVLSASTKVSICFIWIVRPFFQYWLWRRIFFNWSKYMAHGGWDRLGGVCCVAYSYLYPAVHVHPILNFVSFLWNCEIVHCLLSSLFHVQRVCAYNSIICFRGDGLAGSHLCIDLSSDKITMENYPFSEFCLLEEFPTSSCWVENLSVLKVSNPDGFPFNSLDGSFSIDNGSSIRQKNQTIIIQSQCG